MTFLSRFSCAKAELSAIVHDHVLLFVKEIVPVTFGPRTISKLKSDTTSHRLHSISVEFGTDPLEATSEFPLGKIY